VITEEQKKYDKEYEEFVKNLELEKEKYKNSILNIFFCFNNLIFLK
jgi:hypothetical protein